MLRSLKDLERYTVTAADGDIGSVVNFLLDDQDWTVRYLVAETDGFFDGRRVLLSPISLRQADWSTRRLHVALTRDKVKKSPSIDVDKPVSRQHERDYYRYYGYPYYWGYSGIWGMGGYPGLLATGSWNDAPGERSDETGDVHLRSANEVRGYHIQGSDDAIGHVEDFVVDDETWQVRYLVVDTSNWWFGKKVLVAPHWASRVSWEERKVHVDLSRRAIKDSPEWNASAAVNREYEARLYDYYGRPVYWSSGDQPAGKPAVTQSESGAAGPTFARRTDKMTDANTWNTICPVCGSPIPSEMPPVVFTHVTEGHQHQNQAQWTIRLCSAKCAAIADRSPENYRAAAAANRVFGDGSPEVRARVYAASSSSRRP